MDRTDVASDARAVVSGAVEIDAETDLDATAENVVEHLKASELTIDPSDGLTLTGLIDRAALVGRDPTAGTERADLADAAPVDAVETATDDQSGNAADPALDSSADIEDPPILLVDPTSELPSADLPEPEPVAMTDADESTSAVGVPRPTAPTEAEGAGPRVETTSSRAPQAPPAPPHVVEHGDRAAIAIGAPAATEAASAAIPEVPLARRRAMPMPVPRRGRRHPPPGDEAVFVDPDSTSEIMKRPQRPARPLQQPIAVRKAPRPTVRRVSRTLRHVDPWSVFKVALVFNLFMMITSLTAGVFLWQVAVRTGTIDNVERGFENVGWEVVDLKSKGSEIFHNAWMIGLFVVVGLTGLAVLMATLFNLITDLMGGIRLTILEEDLQPRAERFAHVAQGHGGVPGPSTVAGATPPVAPKRGRFGRG